MKSIGSSPIIGRKLPRNLFLFKNKNYYYYEYVDTVWARNIVLRVLYSLVYKPHPSKIVVLMYFLVGFGTQPSDVLHNTRLC